MLVGTVWEDFGFIARSLTVAFRLASGRCWFSNWAAIEAQNRDDNTIQWRGQCDRTFVIEGFHAGIGYFEGRCDGGSGASHADGSGGRIGLYNLQIILLGEGEDGGYVGRIGCQVFWFHFRWIPGSSQKPLGDILSGFWLT